MTVRAPQKERPTNKGVLKTLFLCCNIIAPRINKAKRPYKTLVTFFDVGLLISIAAKIVESANIGKTHQGKVSWADRKNAFTTVSAKINPATINNSSLNESLSTELKLGIFYQDYNI